MNTNRVKCPLCGSWVSAGRISPQCRRRLVSQGQRLEARRRREPAGAGSRRRKACFRCFAGGQPRRTRSGGECAQAAVRLSAKESTRLRHRHQPEAARPVPCSATIDGERMSTDTPHLSGKERRLFATRNRQMMGLTLILLVAVCLIAGGFEHKKNLRKYNQK